MGNIFTFDPYCNLTLLRSISNILHVKNVCINTACRIQWSNTHDQYSITDVPKAVVCAVLSVG